MVTKQLSVFLQNETGRVLEMTGVLGKAGVNIRTISIAESQEYGIVRMIVDKPEKAEAALSESGFSTNVADVLRLTVPDNPGALCGILTALADADINVAYMYGSSYSDSTAPIIMKVNDIGRAVKVLENVI